MVHSDLKIMPQELSLLSSSITQSTNNVKNRPSRKGLAISCVTKIFSGQYLRQLKVLAENKRRAAGNRSSFFYCTDCVFKDLLRITAFSARVIDASGRNVSGL